jgi:hypothetical protein
MCAARGGSPGQPRIPVAIDFSGLSLSGPELVDELQKRGLKVTTMEKQIGLGQDSEVLQMDA